MWTDATSGRLYPEAFSLQGLPLSREPSSVTEPLDFTGLSDNRLTVESQRGLSWTDTQYKFHGMDATDSIEDRAHADRLCYSWRARKLTLLITNAHDHSPMTP